MISLPEYLEHNWQLSSSEIDDILAYFKPIQVKKSEHFLRAGSQCTHIAFINSGVMRNYSINSDGSEVVDYMTSDGDFNTVYQYFVSREICPENIQAVTDCDLHVIHRKDFFELKENSPTFQNLVEQLVIDGLTCKEQRLKSYLSEDAQKRYENLLAHQPKVVQYSPLRYIASYLGITRETLSRIRNRKIPEV
ncbi:MAG: Crp/Fnr family transcriptional regulator [Bacteroidota bacterium]